jgi:hypothetical protein
MFKNMQNLRKKDFHNKQESVGKWNNNREKHKRIESNFPDN